MMLARAGEHPRLALLLLTGLNFLNYIDRYILAGVQPLVQDEFHKSNAEIGLLTSAFLICYMIASPAISWLGDRYSRRNIIMAGAIVWSAATLLTALTRDYTTMLVRHTVVGIGEASFVAIAPAYLGDLFPVERRGRVLSIFYMAIPIGAALGYILGGQLGPRYGWRMPFYVCAGPGIAIAMLLLLLRDPQRGAYDGSQTGQRLNFPPLTNPPAFLAGLWDFVVKLFSNRAFLTATLGMTMYTFAIGGMSAWMPTFFLRERNIPLGKGTLIFGGISVLTGFLGTAVGGVLGDRWLSRDHRAYYLLSAWSMAACAPLAVLSVFGPRSLMFPTLALALFCLFLNTGPMNTAIVNSVNAHIRSTAIALQIFVIHLFGDATSPTIIGAIADRSSLAYGFIPAFATIAASAIVLFCGARYAPVLSKRT